MPVIIQIIKKNASWSWNFKSGDNSTAIEDELLSSELTDEELAEDIANEANEAVEFIPEAKHMTYDFYNNLPENENYVTEEDNSITTVSEYQEPNLEEVEGLEESPLEAPTGDDFDLASSTPTYCYGFPWLSYTGSYITDVTVTSSQQVIKFYIRFYGYTNKGAYQMLPRRHVYGPDGLKCGTPNSSGYSLCEWTPNKAQLDQYVHSVSWYGMDATGRYTTYWTRHFRLKDATTVEVACSATSATISASVSSFLPNLSSAYFSKTVLNIGTCKYTFPSSGAQTRSISLASCGGKWSQGSKIAVEWDVSATDPTTGTITASKVFKFKAKCEYASQVNMMSSAFNVKYGVTTTQISGSSTVYQKYQNSAKNFLARFSLQTQSQGTFLYYHYRLIKSKFTRIII